MNLHHYHAPSFSRPWGALEGEFRELAADLEADARGERPGTPGHVVLTETAADVRALLAIPDGTRHLVVCDRPSGFFSLVLITLAYLALSEKLGFTVGAHWGPRCLYAPAARDGKSVNAWDLFFDPLPLPADIDLASAPREQLLPDSVWITHRNPAMVLSPGRIDSLNRARFGDLLRRHIRPRAEILDHVEQFVCDHFNGRHVIGVHARGNEHDGELAYFRLKRRPLETYFDAVDRAARGNDHAVFLATDQRDILQAFKDRYGRRLVTCEARRCEPGSSLHNTVGGPQVGLDVLTECLLLSRTQHLVHGISNVSTAACYFNPSLPHTGIYEWKRFSSRLAYECAHHWGGLLHGGRTVKARLYRALHA